MVQRLAQQWFPRRNHRFECGDVKASVLRWKEADAEESCAKALGLIGIA